MAMVELETFWQSDDIKELRKRLLFCFLCFIFVFLLCFYENNLIFDLLIWPLTPIFHSGAKVIVTQLTAPLFLPVKLATYFALFLSFPFFLQQIWLFIRPGLYAREREIIARLLWPFLFLFYIGVLLTYLFVLPFLFSYLLTLLPKSVQIMPELGDYLSFSTKMALLFGLIFELPLFLWLLIDLKILDEKKLKTKRPLIYVMTFTIAMLLTPPDVISQIILALPFCILFELTLFFLRWKK